MDFRGEKSITKNNDDDFLISNHCYSQQPSSHFIQSNTIVKTSLLFVVMFLTCLVLNQFDYLAQLCYKSYSLVPHGNSTKVYKSLDHPQLNANYENTIILERTLAKASMKEYDKTVIITTLNAAWTEPNSIFDLFLESFKIGNGTRPLLQHLVVVALDKKAYSRCLEVHLHCFALTTDGVDFSRHALFGSGDYLKMMWRRIEFLRTVLELGYNFVFTDADIMWFRNPFQRFLPLGDFQIACDVYKNNSTYKRNLPNGGFNYVKSNNQTIRFYKYWHKARESFPGKHDQDVLNLIKFDPFLSEIGFEIRYLNTAYFGGFCQPSKDLDLVVTMHANCCIGVESKIHDIKLLIDDWKNYLANLDNDEGKELNRTWRRSVEWICRRKKNVNY